MNGLIIPWVLVALFVIGLDRIAFGQKTAEECLSNYLLDYDDFYQEFGLCYRSEIFSVRHKENQKVERLRVIDGIVIESDSRKLRYAGCKTAEPIGSEKPSTIEELVLDGKFYNKQYGSFGDNRRIQPSLWNDRNTPAPRIVSAIQPHGLALLRDIEMRARDSEMRRCAGVLLGSKRFVQEFPLENGGVRGVWETANKALQCTIDFATQTPALPVKVTWESIGKVENGTAKCTTITKWIKTDDAFVPKEIQISSKLGAATTEVRIEFAFLKKSTFEREINNIKPGFANESGSAWIERFSSWFDQDQDLISK
jgi:hypothetical protein